MKNKITSNPNVPMLEMKSIDFQFMDTNIHPRPTLLKQNITRIFLWLCQMSCSAYVKAGQRNDDFKNQTKLVGAIGSTQKCF